MANVQSILPSHGPVCVECVNRLVQMFWQPPYQPSPYPSGNSLLCSQCSTSEPLCAITIAHVCLDIRTDSLTAGHKIRHKTYNIMYSRIRSDCLPCRTPSHIVLCLWLWLLMLLLLLSDAARRLYIVIASLDNAPPPLDKTNLHTEKYCLYRFLLVSNSF